MRFYTRFLAATLRWRYATLVSGVALFSAAIYATTLLPTGFLPDEDTSRVVVSVELPPGTQLDDTLGKTDQMVKTLRAIPEVSQVFVLGGTSPTGQLEVRRACAIRQACAEDAKKADAEAIENHHRREAFRHSGQPRLVRERARRARTIILDAVAQRR